MFQALAKYATILYVVHEMLGDKDMARASLGQLKAAWDIFASNRQKYPLVYECRFWFIFVFGKFDLTS